MNEWAVDLLTLDDLQGDQRDLAELIGMEAYHCCHPHDG